MSTYEGGFAQGERDSFYDRMFGLTREMREDPTTEEQRGYWDAYSSRSATWDAMIRTPVKPVGYEEAN